jgi:3-hydroxyisobutyrate dehydrogenase-like beta-hydroxyacid dehydrogenase
MELRICLLGFGEVGQILATDLAARNFELSAWDLKFLEPGSAPLRALIRHSKVRAAENVHAAVSSADVVLCAVTAEQTLAAARAAAPSLAPAAYFVDLNSASPGVKQQAARIVHGGAGRYVEAAVMSAFPGKRLTAPIHLGGPHAEVFANIARELGFTNIAPFSTEIGPASAAKMSRSIMVKGLEALLLESMLTARHYGVEQAVLDSLADLLPIADWRGLSRYMISRALLHGRRRAEEMQEACAAVEGALLTPIMSAAIAARQAWAGEFSSLAMHDSLEPLLDALRQQLI